ncbi:MAG: GHKL domain-containing protein [Bacteroidetes bacterium]|nr:GHKL domain-containing protein [Bacteroidota bacterium]
MIVGIAEFWKRVCKYVCDVGITDQIEDNLAKRIRLTNQFTALIILIASSYIFTFRILGFKELSNITILATLSFLLIYFFNWKKWYLIARNGFIILINLLVLYYSFILGKEAHMHMIFFALACCPWLLFNPQERVSIVLGVGLSIGIFFFYLFQQVTPFVSIPPDVLKTISATLYVVVFLVSGLSVGLLSVSNGKSEKKLEWNHKELLQLYIQVSESNEKLKKQQRLQELNLELQNTLEQKVRVNQKLERFSYVMAHDLKSPLSGSIGLIQLIGSELKGYRLEKAGEYLATAEENLIRLAELIDSVLEYSKSEHQEQNIQEVDSGLLVKEIVDGLFLPSEIKVSVSNSLPVLKTNRFKLHQVFQNLIGNAVKYNDKVNAHIQVNCEEKDSFYLFSVSDNGPGIRPEDQERLFDLFEISDRSATQSQTGIGLNIVKVLVEEQGGNVQMKAEMGKGSTFTFEWKDLSGFRSKMQETMEKKG